MLLAIHQAYTASIFDRFQLIFNRRSNEFCYFKRNVELISLINSWRDSENMKVTLFFFVNL